MAAGGFVELEAKFNTHLIEQEYMALLNLCHSMNGLVVNVWLEKDYSRCQTIIVENSLTTGEVKARVDERIGKDAWHYYDIW